MVGARGAHARVTLRRYRAAYNAPRTRIMDALERVERLLMELSPPEKARLLQRLARDIGHAFPGIESTPGVAGGEPRIMRTRIPVWVLAQARRLGAGEADLLRWYPTLRAEDLVNAWQYIDSHRDAIDAQIRDNESA